MNSFLENRPVLAAKGPALNSASQEGGFKPLAPDGPARKAKSEGIPVAELAAESEPRVELIQAGGRVERIVVTCTCCNRIELQCQY